MSLLLAGVAGALIGIVLGALGGGGSILAVPVLVYLLDQSAAQATTGSLVVVGVTAAIAALSAHRAGNVLLGRGVSFGLVTIGGAAVGARLSARVSDAVLLISFGALLLIVGGLMAARLARQTRLSVSAENDERDRDHGPTGTNEPIISFRDGFTCDCRRALILVVSATVVGLLTGFLGVGGGFLIVPALVLVMAIPMNQAVGTSLVVITLTSAAALTARAGSGVAPDWSLVAILTTAAAIGALLGTRIAGRTDTTKLSVGFTILVFSVAVFTIVQTLPALI